MVMTNKTQGEGTQDKCCDLGKETINPSGKRVGQLGKIYDSKGGGPICKR